MVTVNLDKFSTCVKFSISLRACILFVEMPLLCPKLLILNSIRMLETLMCTASLGLQRHCTLCVIAGYSNCYGESVIIQEFSDFVMP